MFSLVLAITPIIILATTLVVLQRTFKAASTRQRSQLLASISSQNAQSQYATSSLKEPARTVIAGFLHPYCNAGGGGERVLFAAISYLQKNEPNVLSVVYTGDVDAPTGLPIAKSEILKRCKERFGIELEESKVHFVQLKWRWLVEDSTWKRFTLLGQGIGAALLAMEAMWRLTPDVFLDTHGLAFSYPVARFLSNGLTTTTMPIVAYIHYPTISASMLSRVSNRETTYANNSAISSSAWRSTAKLLYYRLFSFLYTSALLLPPPTFLVVNSSWTAAHVRALLSTRQGSLPSLPATANAMIALLLTLAGWNVPKPERINQPPVSKPSSPAEKAEPIAVESATGVVRTIYPPCDVDSLRDFSLQDRRRVIFGCAQFRPEKDHAKQINAFAILFKDHPELFVSEDIAEIAPAAVEQSGWLHVDDSRPPSPVKPQRTAPKEALKMVLLGSARHKEDLTRVEELRKLTKEMGVEAHVEFRLNASYDELLNWLSVSSIGISTMVEEHFGIGVVEFMGAGLIPVVHASGGPIMDIVTPVEGKPTGYLAETAEEFAAQLYTALTMNEEEALQMRALARESSARFSTVAFETGFGTLWEDVKTAL